MLKVFEEEKIIMVLVFFKSGQQEIKLHICLGNIKIKRRRLELVSRERFKEEDI